MLLKYWDLAEDIVISVLAGIALLIVCYEVFARYLAPQLLTDWGSEVVVYLVVWALLLGGSSLVKSGRHIRADLVLRVLPRSGRRFIEGCNLVVGLAYCAIVARFGVESTLFAKMLDGRGESSLQFPLWIFYAALPTAFALMTLRYAIRLFCFLFQGAQMPEDLQHGAAPPQSAKKAAT